MGPSWHAGFGGRVTEAAQMPEMANTETAAYALTVADLLRKQAGTRAHAVALQDARGVLSYGELDRAASRLAQAMLVRGLRAGDRVAVLSENCREYLQLQLAAAKIGVVVACLNWRLADAEITHCLRLVSPCMVFVSCGTHRRWRASSTACRRSS
jgi:acyl-CoA synthetase (AMP-forming)/AMP-acid ligase II